MEVNQTELRKRTGWGKSTASEICNGKTNYYREILNEAADALHIQPFELLMHPDEAMAFRQLRGQALRIVEMTPPTQPVESPRAPAPRLGRKKSSG